MNTAKKILASALLLAVAVAMLSGCGFISRGINGDIVISGGTLIDVNDRAELDMEGVDSIEISGVSDEVTILAGGSKAVAELTGQCRSVGKPVWLDARKAGGRLIIEVKYPNSAIRSNNTRLTVTIPEGYAGSLTAGTVSGSVTAEELPFKLDRAKLGTVSGNIRFSTAAFEELECGAVSGRVEVDGIAAPVKVNTVSGDVRLAYAAPADTNVVTVSGAVAARFPKDAAFRVEFGSVSGDFRSSHPAINVSKSHGSFSAAAGDGTALIRVNTTSGNFEIEE